MIYDYNYNDYSDLQYDEMVDYLDGLSMLERYDPAEQQAASDILNEWILVIENGRPISEFPYSKRAYDYLKTQHDKVIIVRKEM